MAVERNMGINDRTFRAVVAVVLAFLYFTDVINGVLGTVLLTVGVIFLLTSSMGWCPIYRIFKWSSKKEPDHFE